MNPERAWETLMSRLREARHPAGERLRAARLLPSENGAFHVALARADDLDALAGTECALAAVLEDLLKHPVRVEFVLSDELSDADADTRPPDAADGASPAPDPHAAGAVGAEQPMAAYERSGSAGGMVCFDPLLRRKRVCTLGACSPLALKVLTYLETCVCTRDGWTWGLSQRRLSDELGTGHFRIGEALDLLADAGILIDRRKDEKRAYLTRYRLDGYSYVAGESGYTAYPPRIRGVPTLDESGYAAYPHMSLVDVVAFLRRLSPRALTEILQVLEDQQQQQDSNVDTPRTHFSGEVDTPRTHPGESGYAMYPPIGRSLPCLDAGALDPDRRLAHHWLAGYRIVGPILLELLGFRVEDGALVDTGDAPDPERVIGLVLEIERDRRDGQVEDAHATGRLVTYLRGDVAQPWALTRRFVHHVRQTGEAPMVGEIDLLDGDFARLLDDMLRGLRLFAYYDPARYTSGVYADYIES